MIESIFVSGEREYYLIKGEVYCWERASSGSMKKITESDIVKKWESTPEGVQETEERGVGSVLPHKTNY